MITVHHKDETFEIRDEYCWLAEEMGFFDGTVVTAEELQRIRSLLMRALYVEKRMDITRGRDLKVEEQVAREVSEIRNSRTPLLGKFVIFYDGNRFHVPKKYVPRFKALGIKHGFELSEKQIKPCLTLFNQIRYELGLLPSQQGTLTR